MRAIVTPTPVAATRSSARLRPSARWLADGWNDGVRITTYLEAALLACEVSCRARRGFAVAVTPRFAPGTSFGSPALGEEVRPDPTIAGGGPWPRWEDGPVRTSTRRLGRIGGSGYNPRSERSFGPVGMCGFDRAWLPGNASRGCCSGLVNQAAKRSTWQPPVDSRSRRLGGRVSVEAASASRVVEASFSGAAIRTSVA